MALYPRTFVEDLRNHADIVAVIQDYVTLRKVGNTFKGLCPFHNEKTPSFNVNREKGFFHCFGCNTSGDVFKFLELHDKVGFADAVKLVAQRFGLSLPEPEQTDEQRASSVERENLLKVHEAASAWFASQLATAAGVRVRKQLADRGVSEATWKLLGLGFAPPGRDGLRAALLKQGFSEAVLLRAGLVVQRDDGTAIDRFRNRLMIPIARDSGSVIAFGGRALEDGQGPKYLNSPETPIYSKGRTLYGLNLSKAAIRQGGFAVLVEGYFDFAQLYQGGFQAVIASCGTALTVEQAKQLKRFTDKVVLSYDPDTAGQTAAARSSELLVAEGFRVNVAILEPGEDPDLFIRRHGPQGYRQRLEGAQPYLEYLLERTAARYDLNGDDGRVRFLAEMIPIAARIPDALARDRFADRLAHRSFVSPEVVRNEIRRAMGGGTAAPRGGEAPRRTELPAFGRMMKAERALIWWLMNRPDAAWPALERLEAEDFAGLASRSVLDLARKLNEDSGFSPHVLVQRLSAVEAHLVTAIATEAEPPAVGLISCVLEIQRTRYARERAAVQREIERLQSSGASQSPEMDALLGRLGELGRVIQALVLSEE
jgi:DNA primase